MVGGQFLELWMAGVADDDRWLLGYVAQGGAATRRMGRHNHQGAKVYHIR